MCIYTYIHISMYDHCMTFPEHIAAVCISYPLVIYTHISMYIYMNIKHTVHAAY